MVMSVMAQAKPSQVIKSSNPYSLNMCDRGQKDAGVGPHPVLDVPCGGTLGQFDVWIYIPRPANGEIVIDSYRHVVGPK